MGLETASVIGKGTLSAEQILAQAASCFQAAQYEKAASLCSAVLETQPLHAEANYFLGVLAVQSGQPANAIPYFIAALDAEPSRRTYWLCYIDALIQAGYLENAREVLELALQQGLQGEDVVLLVKHLAEAEACTPATLEPVTSLSASLAQDSKSKASKAKGSAATRSAQSSKNIPENQEINILLSLFKQNLCKEAAALAQSMTLRFPSYGFGWKALGVAYKQMGQSAAALAPMQKAITLLPGDADVHSNMGAALHDLGRMIEAEASLRRALQIDPKNAQALSNMGLTLQTLGRYTEAEATLKKVLKLKPDFAEAHNNLGNALKAQGRLSEAQASYRRALQINPNFAVVHYNLGILHSEAGRLDMAEASYRQALRIDPNYATAYNNLGITLKELNRPDEAEACYNQALKIDPDYPDAFCNLGVLQMSQGQLGEAEQSYLRALQLCPGFAIARNNLGVTLQDMGKLDEAEACFRSALDSKADSHAALANMAGFLMATGRLDESGISTRRALEIKPEYAEAQGNLLFALNYHPDLGAEEIYRAYQEFDARRAVPLRSSWRAHPNDKDPERRLRIGYVSPDFKKHSCRYFLEPLLSHHDKARVEVYAYAELAREDEMSLRYKKLVEHWLPTKGMSDEVLAERIRSDKIDILVELAGHTAGNRLLAFARKPAPVSVSWLGYGYTTGLSAIDYYLTDLACVPLGSENLFAESPFRIATPAYAYRPAADMGEVNSLPALKNGYIRFGTLTRSIRVNHRTIRVWAEILAAVPNSRLVMNSLTFKESAMQDRIAAQFLQHGIQRDRLDIGFHSPPWDVLRGMDIGLDCFPHNSGTTLFETLYMGVPYITLAGRPSVGRLGSSILQGVAHQEWIATSEEDYREKAVKLASDVAHLSQFRRSLRGQMENSPLMDEAGFTLKVEQAYREMWKIWCTKMNK